MRFVLSLMWLASPCLTLVVSAFDKPWQQSSPVPTPVTIVSFGPSKDGQRLIARVKGATTSSQLVVFVRTAKRLDFHPALNESGEPAFPTILSNTLGKGDDMGKGDYFGELPELQEESFWSVEFRSEDKADRLLEIYAIVCDVVKKRPDWPKSRDYRGFMYLPFSKADDIYGVLDILKSFGWIPTGYTQIKP